MKRCGVITVVLLASCWMISFAAPSADAADTEQNKPKTLWVAKVLSSETSTAEERVLALTYVDHVMGSIEGYRPDFFKKLYPNQSRVDIVQKVVFYYQNNPAERNRKVADVLLAGCK